MSSFLLSVVNTVLLPLNEYKIMQFSYWEQQSFLSGYDVAIIGAGIVGLSAGLYLKRNNPSLKILILERGFLPSGASTKNAGFACFGSVTEILDDIQSVGLDATMTLVKKRYEGLKALLKNTGQSDIQYYNRGGYEVFKKEDDEIFEKCQDFIPELNEHFHAITDSKATFLNADHKIQSFGFNDVAHIIENHCEGQIHTGMMMKKLIEVVRCLDIDIYFGAEVSHFQEEGTNVSLHFSGQQSIKVKKLLVCTNGFAKQLLPNLKVRPARNQVLVTKPYKNLKLNACFHYDRGYFYWREIDGRILLGGGRNLFPEIESSDIMATNQTILDYLEKMLREWICPHEFPGIDMQWTGILGIGESKSPIIEKISENIGVAVRMGGMGVALGTLAGQEGAKKILDMDETQATA